MIAPVFKALLSHYRRRPFQILLVWVGLTLGTALLVGVMAVNHHAKQSYAQGDRIFSNPLPYRVRSLAHDEKMPQGLYVQLKQAGFNQCIPLDTATVETSQGVEMRLVGFDPISILSFQNDANINRQANLALMKPPYPILMSPQFSQRYQLKAGDFITLNNGMKIGPIIIDQTDIAKGSYIFMDISSLKKITQTPRLSLIACGAMSANKAERLRALLPNNLYLSRYTGMELTSLTKAFHMNLSALGMLAFLVGMFIFYQAMARSFAQRQQLVGLLRLLGVHRFRIAAALSVEIILWVLLSWLSGNIIGLALANYLLPQVVTTLNGLYHLNMNINAVVEWDWVWSFQSLTMVFIACIIASVWPFIRLMRTIPIDLSMRLSLSRFSGAQFGWEAMIGCVFIVAAVALYLRPPSQSIGFMLIASIMLSVGLILPFVLLKIFTLFSVYSKTIHMRWFFSDCVSSMNYRGVGAMAFMLAIAANIGIQTVVDSFRDTTKDWLSQRLAADIYLVPSKATAPAVVSWLEKRPETQEVWWRWEQDISVDNETMQVVSSGTSKGEKESLSIKSAQKEYWAKLHQGMGVLISESLALKHKIQIGDNLLLPEPFGHNWKVLGIYYDYGNPFNQLLISENNWNHYLRKHADVGLGIVVKKETDILKYSQDLQNEFKLSQDRIFNNKTTFDNAMSVFEKAFSITNTLSRFTLFIALLGLFFATIAAEMAKRNQFALMRSLGLTAKELVYQAIGQMILMGFICLAFAVPLGIIIAKILMDYVLKSAFGWTMALSLDITQLIFTVVFVSVTLLIAATWPTYMMIKNSPTKLFQGTS